MRVIPGSVSVPGREFRYLRCASQLKFTKLFDELGDYRSDPAPRSGGLISENAVLGTPTGEQYFGVSYKGDVDGWRAHVAGFCVAAGIDCAVVVDGRLQLPEGESVALSDCDAEFY